MVDSKLLSCSFAKKQGCGHILAATCENGAIIILNTEPPWYYTSMYSELNINVNLSINIILR